MKRTESAAEDTTAVADVLAQLKLASTAEDNA